MIEPRFRWRTPAPVTVDPAAVAEARRWGASERLAKLLARRGVRAPADVAAFFAAPEAGLGDPWLLPDAGAALRRVAEARQRGERVLVYGDFDADGLCGLSILALALRRLGIDAAPYVPERLDEGHGLSMRAVGQALAEGRSLIVTADCGTSSGPEIEQAVARGVDVIVTDHHHAPTWPAAALAVVNPQRPDGRYPDRRLTGAGVAFAVARLLLGELGGGDRAGESARAAAAVAGADTVAGAVAIAGLDLADLALIGTVADVAPLIGENRAIARLGLDRLRAAPRLGIAALLARAAWVPQAVDVETISFAIAPRLNAAGRVGEAARAGRLLLSEDASEAERLAAEIEAANDTRRELTRVALAEAQAILAEATEVADAAAVLIRGEWPVGIIGLLAGKLAEERGRPAIVATLVDPAGGLLRASCRSPRGFDLADALVRCQDLLIRHGGHAAAAGFEVQLERWPELEARLLSMAAAADLPAGPPELDLDLAMPAGDVGYDLVRELSLLAPAGPGNADPLVGIGGLTVVRVRAATGGHSQLVLRRQHDVLDAVAFRRPDLAEGLAEGERVDVVARLASRRFGGFESLQLEVQDVAPAGHIADLVAAGRRAAASETSELELAAGA